MHEQFRGKENIVYKMQLQLESKKDKYKIQISKESWKTEKKSEYYALLFTAHSNHQVFCKCPENN